MALNGLRLAANQTTGRDPVTGHPEGERSGERSRRSATVRNLLDEALQLTPSQLAVPAVLIGGWLRVDAADDLAEWVARGVGYASTLPAK